MNASSYNPRAAVETGGANADPVAAILDVLRRAERVMVCSHARPDGDAVGSMMAMAMLLKQMGKQAEVVSADKVPHLYRLLPGTENIRVTQRVAANYDAVIMLECDGIERTGLEGLDGQLLINIDHHYSGRDYARLNWIDQQAVSVGAMVYRLAVAAQVRITPAMATCLYTTLLTDTGGFQYGFVNASTFEMARELVLAGADPVMIAQSVCFSAPFSKMLLLGAALQTLQREGQVAWLWVNRQDMMRTCAAEEDCEGVVNFALGIANIQAAAFLRELTETQVRVSLRSKGKLNVAAIAERLGGGGHKNAAGCTLDLPLARALETIPKLLGEALEDATGA
jgi:phosphoesterase RecJ-like protein